ncbi:hypothetical protein [Aureimonas jatrophae]|jgi:hypothetical protein|uniref:Lipoprotein-attachment site-containing protein n=1 Tax=Aureimonas jatrophae TaxID=1166073 RepID=A0A1H0LJT9_9HYPH|nr:hypothetical protein [Aureimonas jatrophae]MBB3952547.1 hypothetical protein [Aureimonas jatrophae]SDO68343.1 hypothetical protein SAMN05192530_11064 [Aureimonas jatrophae]
MRTSSRTIALTALVASVLALGACQSNGGRLTPTGTGQTPSSGTVPGQTPQ